MKALIAIDVQRGLLEKRLRTYREQGLLANINLLIRKATAAGGNVYVVQHCSDAVLKEDTEAWQVHPLVALPKKHTPPS